MTVEVPRPTVVLVDPRELKPHPKNPRKGHPLEEILGSMRRFGWTIPILVSADGFIIAGEGRWRAALKEGLEHVPVIRSNLSGDEAAAYMITDNRLTEKTEWDARLLNELLESLPEDLSTLTGFTDEEVKKLLADYEAAAQQAFLDPAIGGARGPREVMAGDPEGRAQEPGVAYVAFQVTPVQKQTIQVAINHAMTVHHVSDPGAALERICAAYITSEAS